MNKRFGSAERGKVVPIELGRTPEIGQRFQAHTGRAIVRIHLLGSMRATSYLGADVLPRGKKARAILAWLCFAAGARVSRARLSAMLWDRVPDAQARTSFRQALRELTSALGPLAGELLLADRDTISLDTSQCWIDAVAVLASASPASSPRGELAALCSGELIEELEGLSTAFDQWLLAERTRFTDRLRSVLESELYQLARDGGDPKQLAEGARHVISFDATHEGASRVLMRALLDMGERAQALREYARCREAVKNGLDAEPSPETQALHEAVRAFAGREERDRGPGAATIVPHQAPAARPALPSRSRLRVGVLPFVGSRSINEDNLAFSLSQEIAGALARFRWFDVIAPISLMRKASESAVSDDQLQRKELDYAVDGALSVNGKHVQISVRLLDLGQYASPVWSDRFELPLGELHHLNEMVTTRIVGRIDPVILFIEGQPKRRERYGATGLILLAIPLMFSMERKKFEEAGTLLNQALAIEPDNAMVIAWAALWQLIHVGENWSKDVEKTLATVEELCVRAIKLDPENAEALGIYGHACAWKKDFDAALHHHERALRLNPSLAFIWALSALTFCYIGEPDVALQRLERYRDLAPFDPYFRLFENVFAIAYALKGDYENAVAVGRRVVTFNPDFSGGYRPLIAALGHLGRLEDAKRYLDKLLKLEPNFSLKLFGDVYPLKRASDRNRFLTGLRMAGVPEV
jgi:DNA-binding SARP family transcriptional activator/TolB-like protein